MAEPVRVASVDDIADGDIQSFQVEDVPVAVANAGGTLYAFHDDCSHQHCPLSDGDVEGDRVVCPCHGSAFDLRTGEVLNPPAAAPIAVYGLRIEGDDVLVEPR